MQFFGARANLAKCLLYAINGGVDEISGKQVGPKYRPITSEYLDYDEVMDKYKDMMKWLAKVYVNALNIIHYNHDKYSYERLQMALHDKKVTDGLQPVLPDFPLWLTPCPPSSTQRLRPCAMRRVL